VRALRLLSIGHSYVVALNRRIAHEIARESHGRWEVTVVSPHEMRGDLRPTPFEPMDHEPCNIEVVPVHWPQQIHFMLYGSRLRNILSQKWDLIHSWEEPYIASGAQIAFHAKKDVPLVFYTFQNLKKTYPPPFSSIEKYCLRRSAGWIAAGTTVEQVLLERKVGYEARPYDVIPLGVDVQKFHRTAAQRTETLQELGWQPGVPVIGFLGRFVPEKGLDLLMRVLDGIQSPWRVLFIGSGPEEANLRTWASRHRDQVRVVTNARHDDVPAYLNACDILCAPSQTAAHWREQFGRMLIEAFATEIAVIASDSGEIPYVVSDAGLVVGEKDEAAWQSAISDLLENPARRTDLASQGLARAHDNFAWPVIARRHIHFFEKLLGENRVRLAPADPVHALET
jgi:glycosyltransferase involved in cell wall biosynthesis